MSRPKRIRSPIETEFFANVSPSWTLPRIVPGELIDAVSRHLPLDRQFHLDTNESRSELKAALIAALKKAGYAAHRLADVWCESIDPEFGEAASALAAWNPGVSDWSEESWAKHPDNTFFRLRDRLIHLTLNWRDGDWGKTEAEFEHRQKIMEAQRAAMVAISPFLVALDDYPSSLEQRYLALEFLRHFERDGRAWHFLDVSGEGAAIAMRVYAAGLKARIAGPFWTGAIEWQSLPRPMPRAETMVGMMLANEVLRWRGPKHTSRQRDAPYGLLQIDGVSLPWTAIALFAGLSLGVVTDAGDLRKKVVSIWPRISRYYWLTPKGE